MTNQFIVFCNSTPLPVIIEAWKGLYGLNVLTHTRIAPYETRVIHSIVGEWHLQTFFEQKDAEAWRKAGHECGYYLGKFRSDACASGNYSWMEDGFECVYTPFATTYILDEVLGHMTFQTC